VGYEVEEEDRLGGVIVVYRKRVDLEPEVRQMLGEELRLSHEAARAAKTAFKVRVYIAVKQGLTTQEIADALGVSQSAVSEYRMQGEALYRERQAAAK
jgi:DNA-binding NarL/FixJ family response regulator